MRASRHWITHVAKHVRMGTPGEGQSRHRNCKGRPDIVFLAGKQRRLVRRRELDPLFSGLQPVFFACVVVVRWSEQTHVSGKLWCDVLVSPKAILGIVLPLDLAKPIEIGAKRLSYSRAIVLAHGIHVH